MTASMPSCQQQQHVQLRPSTSSGKSGNRWQHAVKTNQPAGSQGGSRSAHLWLHHRPSLFRYAVHAAVPPIHPSRGGAVQQALHLQQ